MEKEKAKEKKGIMDSWDKYTCGNFLKAEDISSPDDPYVCIDVYEVEEENVVGKLRVEKLRVELERNKIKYLLDLNKTNAKKLKELGLDAPKDVVGKMIYFVTPLGWNPSDKKEQPVVRISKIS